MEFYKDLLKIEKSKFKIVLGIVAVIISITWFIARIKQNGNLNTFDWIYGIFFGLQGILNIMEGYGISSSRIFGKAFISIDDEKIQIKTHVFSKTQILYWKEIKAINYKTNFFVFTSKNNISTNLKLSEFDYLSIKEIKKTIREIAKKNDIKHDIK
ncbi:hypothetical protein LA303_07830 [Candidatus Sulfidibacterium hydrothermale]|uniref:hypothetical protein n=1 Tax=Candidatus Sulfidibacterium hydrothermale TaxID=2875962 RepID=UPI001F0A3F93|nr:hypothetical protein [Candidatus Sulfidibacterium hydrothermale]UBM61332.1 hypothetical protein LA303_07830 [Candidatus Sulfidibacterium hydrothermale]